METLVHIEKHSDGTYWATSQNLPGVVSTYGDSIKELQDNFYNALQDHLETLEELQDETLDETKKLGKKIRYQYDVSSFISLAKDINISKFSERTQSSANQLRQYKNGTYVSLKKAKDIQKAAHQLGKELLSITIE